MNIILIPPADKELEDAVNYYNNQQLGLGKQFYSTFLNTIDYICIAPKAWKKVGINTRKININRFPYLIFYIIDDNDILITCIAHQHREPKYYSNRIY